MQTYQIVLSGMLALLVLLGISLMSKVKTSVWGNLLSALAMLCGVVATLFFSGILTVWILLVALLIGALIGSVMASRVQMIQMPQMVALFNGLGGGASALVGLMTYMRYGISIDTIQYPHFINFTAVLAIAVGMITLVGSLVAAGKLHRIIDGRPIVYPAHSALTITALVISIILITIGTIIPCNLWIMLSLLIVNSCFGYLFAIRVGGADMPITISLLNSLSGVAGAIAGMAISDVFLVAVGGIVGASGLLLTQIMCRAMNRSLLSILIGGKKRIRKPKIDLPTDVSEENGTTIFAETTDFEKLLEQLNDMEVKQLLDAIEALTKEIAGLREQLAAAPAACAQAQEMKAEEKTPASVLKAAKDVIIVPGYGMALAQAQHIVKQLADRLQANGAKVRFAIHPVAGRMPGHMNVLLAEADIPYEQLYEMEAINDDFRTADAVVVIGANDVLNPAARNAEGTPIYGMPVLNVDEAKEVIVCNYDLKPGYAGVENPIYTRQTGVYLCLGDAKKTLMEIISGL